MSDALILEKSELCNRDAVREGNIMPKPPRIPFREFAADHLALAKQLIQRNTNELRYACLELRLAIEALVYDTLQDYAEDNDDAVRLAYQDWQPDKVLKALSAYDPMTDTSMQITVREVALEGQPDSEKPIFIGIDDRLTTEWVAKAHRSMGSFLHQRTISQVNSGKHVDWKVLTAEARRVIERLDAILASPVHNIRSDIRFGYPWGKFGIRAKFGHSRPDSRKATLKQWSAPADCVAFIAPSAGAVSSLPQVSRNGSADDRRPSECFQ
jgi:hypothetical protein